ncbi:MAG: hypothetical protein ACI381_06655 [Candidatus Methanomethylophilaceae archaeon]
MSTTVGNGLTVDGTVKASQATAAGEAVVLGDDGLVPAELIGGSTGMNQREFSSLSDLLTAVSNGEVPAYAQAAVFGYVVSNYKSILILEYISSGYIMPCHGIFRPTASSYYIYCIGLGSDSKIYTNESSSAYTFTITNIIAYWRD